MNKRITIIDSDVANFNNYVGIGLPNLTTVESLLVLDDDVLVKFMELEEGDGILAIGPKAFELVKKFYHLGIRGENYYDCSLLNRLGTEIHGAYVKVLHEDDDITPGMVDFFNSPEFCSTRDFSKLKWEVVKTYERALTFLDFFLNQPVGTRIGFDYETSGMAMEKEFCITGAAFAIAKPFWASVFFSFTEIKRNSTPEQFKKFKEKFRSVLVKHHENMWVYNMTFESQVTWREFGVELFFCDSSVFNYEDGLHQKNFSLKWTAQRLLGGGDKYHLPGISEGPGIEPWDTDFDRLEDAFSRLYWVDQFTKGRKKPTGKILKCTELDWEGQPEWKEINQLYPGYQEEFRRLVNENFGNPFLNIPADILGKYCCLDSFYTVLIAEENLPRYSSLCHETFQNNLRIFSSIERGGLYIDDDYVKKYESYCHQQMLWGISYAATYRCFKKMEKHRKKAAKLQKYPEFSKLLLERGEFCNGDLSLIARNLLAQNVDLYDNYDTGLDEGGLVLKYGNKFASAFARIVKESMSEIKFKGKIDGTVARKKKLIGSVAEKLATILETDKINFGSRHEELEKLLYYQRAYKDLLSVWKQLDTLDNVPLKIIWKGKRTDIFDVSQDIMNSYYRCSSPIDNTELEQELISEYKLETAFLATIYRDINKLPGEKRYYSNLNIKTPEEALEHFSYFGNIFWKHYNAKTGICLWPENVEEAYPQDVFKLFYSLYKDPKNDWNTEIWGDWKGYDKQADFFPEYVKNEVNLLGKKWDESDMELSPFTKMRKLLINILLYKKYNKVRSTYTNTETGIFSRGERYVIDSPQMMTVRYADPDEPGAVKKSFVRYEVMKKTTKRNSGPFHVLPSVDFRKMVTCPNININGKQTATLISYFDISSAEVRTLAYRSGDKGLINLFETGQDVYIYTAKSMLGEKKWNGFDKGEKKKWRKIFKVVYLAVAYRMSARTLGQQLNVPEEEAQGYITSLFDQFPVLEKFIEENSSYPINHDGYVNTELGDRLRVPEYRFLYEKDQFGRPRFNSSAARKLDSAGINFRIQSFSSLSLTSGFSNVVQEAVKEGIYLKNVGVIHDSCQNLLDINQLWNIVKFYRKNFYDYVYDEVGIRFDYDLEIGIDYANMMEVRLLEDNKLKISGTASALRVLLEKIKNNSDLRVKCDTDENVLIPKIETSSLKRFIKKHQTCMELDESEYTITLEKLN